MKLKKNRLDEVNVEIDDSNDSTPLNENDSFKPPKRDINVILELCEIAGFIGLLEYSPNGKFILIQSDSSGKIALLKNKKLIFKKQVERPNFCKVNNEGTILCMDWLNSSELSGMVIVFDNQGNEIYSIKTTANLGDGSISSDSKFIVFETANSDTDDGRKTFIVNLVNKEVTKFTRPIHFNSAIINSEEQTLILIDRNECELHINFEGKPINDVYFKQLLESKHINDLLVYFYRLPKNVKFNNDYYLKGLELAIEGKTETYSFGGFDKIYREIGEYFEVKKDIEKTIFYWEKAIEINPNVGVKTRLKKYKT